MTRGHRRTPCSRSSQWQAYPNPIEPQTERSRQHTLVECGCDNDSAVGRCEAAQVSRPPPEFRASPRRGTPRPVGRTSEMMFRIGTHARSETSSHQEPSFPRPRSVCQVGRVLVLSASEAGPGRLEAAAPCCSTDDFLSRYPRTEVRLVRGGIRSPEAEVDSQCSHLCGKRDSTNASTAECSSERRRQRSSSV